MTVQISSFLRGCIPQGQKMANIQCFVPQNTSAMIIIYRMLSTEILYKLEMSKLIGTLPVVISFKLKEKYNQYL